MIKRIQRQHDTAARACILTLALAVPAIAQQQIRGGNVLDASNRLGSGGLNYAAQRTYNFNAGNRIVTGNVTGGRAFRGYSPIRSSNSLFLGNPLGSTSSFSLDTGTAGVTYSTGLPSDSLSTFNRDSYSYYDARRRQQAGGLNDLYYAPGSTVANTGNIIAGQNMVGTSQFRTPYVNPQPGLIKPYDPLAGVQGAQPGASLALPTRLVRTDTGQFVTGRTNDRLLRSSLFRGAFREVPVTNLEEAAQAQAHLGAAMRQGDGVQGPLDVRVRDFQPEDPRIMKPTAPTQEAPDRRMGSSLDQILARAAADGDWEASLLRRPDSADRTAERRRMARGAPAPSTRLTGSFRGADNVFNRMLDIRDEITGGTGTTAEGERQARPAGAPGADQPDDPARTRRPAVVPEEIQFTRLRTFVGTKDSVLNQHLANAERALQDSRFYRASACYELAHTVAPDNPLPLLGRATALLAAGDYMTSVSELFRAIHLFESLSLFQIDLPSFVPDLNVLDRRRADLESRLALHDDYRLRFLLGFAEYCSGLTDRGIANMEQAIASAPIFMEVNQRPNVPRDDSARFLKEPLAKRRLRAELIELEKDRNLHSEGERRRAKRKLRAEYAPELGMSLYEVRQLMNEMVEEIREADSLDQFNTHQELTRQAVQTEQYEQTDRSIVKLRAVQRFVEDLKRRTSPLDEPIAVPSE